MGRSHRPRPLRLGKKLRQIRSHLHLTQAEMIARLKAKEPLTPASISGYEASQREPSLLVLLSYARLAETIVDVLIDDRLELPTQKGKRVVK
jgi:transcriptional regulator with XRE-family HTH domain